MKIMTGGVGKDAVASKLTECCAGKAEVVKGNDMDAAIKLRSNQIDYYLGTCHTGAGASLGVLVGLLGSDKCHTFGRNVPSEQEVREAVESGAVVFGFSIDQIDVVVPLLWAVVDKK